MRRHFDGNRETGRGVTGRALHWRIRDGIEKALGSRNWAWLAKEAGIPQSTLSTQVTKPKFNVDTLCRIARVLEVDLNELLCVHDGS